MAEWQTLALAGGAAFAAAELSGTTSVTEGDTTEIKVPTQSGGGGGGELAAALAAAQPEQQGGLSADGVAALAAGVGGGSVPTAEQVAAEIEERAPDTPNPDDAAETVSSTPAWLQERLGVSPGTGGGSGGGSDSGGSDAIWDSVGVDDGTALLDFAEDPTGLVETKDRAKEQLSSWERSQYSDVNGVISDVQGGKSVTDAVGDNGDGPIGTTVSTVQDSSTLQDGWDEVQEAGDTVTGWFK